MSFTEVGDKLPEKSRQDSAEKLSIPQANMCTAAYLNEEQSWLLVMQTGKKAATAHRPSNQSEKLCSVLRMSGNHLKCPLFPVYGIKYAAGLLPVIFKDHLV